MDVKASASFDVLSPELVPIGGWDTYLEGSGMIPEPGVEVSCQAGNLLKFSLRNQTPTPRGTFVAVVHPVLQTKSIVIPLDAEVVEEGVVETKGTDSAGVNFGNAAFAIDGTEAYWKVVAESPGGTV